MKLTFWTQCLLRYHCWSSLGSLVEANCRWCLIELELSLASICGDNLLIISSISYDCNELAESVFVILYAGIILITSVRSSKLIPSKKFDIPFRFIFRTYSGDVFQRSYSINNVLNSFPLVFVVISNIRLWNWLITFSVSIP